MSTKAISTWVSDFFLFIVRLCEFIFVGNPLSMFVYNLLFPREAAEFAQNRYIFGERIYAFYEHLALEWPFHWAKWWMKLENLANYTTRQQIKYLFKVAFRNGTEVEALKAMPRDFDGTKEFWPKVYEELFFVYGKKVLPLKRRDLENRENTPKWYLCYVAEFMMQNIRLSYQALAAAIAWAAKDENVRKTLKKYLASGKLNDAQFKLLIDAVTTSPHSGDLQMFGVLLDYITNYGISEQNLELVKSQFPQQFIELVEEAATKHIQTKALKSFKDTDEGRSEWRVFCAETPDILPEVQALMSLRQYAIFHNVGRKLDVKAIKAFLSRSDKVLWRAVFVKENDACRCGEIRDFIRNEAKLELAYRDYLETQKSDSEN